MRQRLVTRVTIAEKEEFDAKLTQGDLLAAVFLQLGVFVWRSRLRRRFAEDARAREREQRLTRDVVAKALGAFSQLGEPCAAAMAFHVQHLLRCRAVLGVASPFCFVHQPEQ